MPWTDEMVESLKKMWDEGLSTGEIGKRLGVSKNSIVGKVHRLQLIARPSPIKKKDASDDGVEKTKAKPKAVKSQPVSPAPKQEKEVKTPTVSKEDNKKNIAEPEKKTTEAKPVPTKQPKDNDSYLNVSIPIVHTPKKPGDKITVTDLDNHTCRWPIGDPKDDNFHFCGAPVKIGQTYCEEHAAIAYVKNIKK